MLKGVVETCPTELAPIVIIQGDVMRPERKTGRYRGCREPFPLQERPDRP